MIARLTLWDTIGAFLIEPKAPARSGLSFILCVSAAPNRGGKCGVGQWPDAALRLARLARGSRD
jgi:hypothetical protein